MKHDVSEAAGIFKFQNWEKVPLIACYRIVGRDHQAIDIGFREIESRDWRCHAALDGGMLHGHRKDTR